MRVLYPYFLNIRDMLEPMILQFDNFPVVEITDISLQVPKPARSPQFMMTS